MVFAHHYFTLFEKSKNSILIKLYNFLGKSKLSTQKCKSPNIFTSFSPKYLLAIFLVKSKLSTAKKSKSEAFSRVFTQNNWTIFLGISKLNFWTKKWRYQTVWINTLKVWISPSFPSLSLWTWRGHFLHPYREAANWTSTKKNLWENIGVTLTLLKMKPACRYLLDFSLLR